MSERDEQTVDIDEKFNDEVNATAVNEGIKSALPPQGTYQTNPEEYPLNAFLGESDEKDESGSVISKRRTITFTGLVSGVFQGETVTNRIRFTISPDRRKKRDFETRELTEKDDIRTRLYDQAVKTYEKSVGEMPKRNNDLVEWLKSNPFNVRTFNTADGESMVITISPRGRRG